MSGPFQFAVRRDVVSLEVAERRDQIAREIGGPGCGFIAADLPEGPRSWGVAPNRGAPHDAETAREIMAAWTAAGVGVR